MESLISLGWLVHVGSNSGNDDGDSDADGSIGNFPGNRTAAIAAFETVLKMEEMHSNSNQDQPFSSSSTDSQLDREKEKEVALLHNMIGGVRVVLRPHTDDTSDATEGIAPFIALQYLNLFTWFEPYLCSGSLCPLKTSNGNVCTVFHWVYSFAQSVLSLLGKLWLHIPEEYEDILLFVCIIALFFSVMMLKWRRRVPPPR